MGLSEAFNKVREKVRSGFSKKLDQAEKRTLEVKIDTRDKVGNLLGNLAKGPDQDKKTNLDSLFNTKILNKKIQVINNKTGTVREFIGYTKTGKPILMNTTTGQKEIATRELLEKDIFDIEEELSPEEAAKMADKIIKERNKDYLFGVRPDKYRPPNWLDKAA